MRRAAHVKSLITGDLRNQSRLASALLLLPMVIVAVASGIGLAANNVASTALDSANQLDRLLSVRDQLHEVTLSGTGYLLDASPLDRTAFTRAGREVDTQLAALGANSGLNPRETAVLAAAARAWQATALTRREVATGAAADPRRSALQDQLVGGVDRVTAQLRILDGLNTAEVKTRQQQRMATANVSAVAIVVAIMVGFLGALWLLRQLRERQEAVRERERRLSALVEHASDGILVIDGGGEVVFATPAFGQDFIGHVNRERTLDAVVHSDDRVQTTKAWQRVISGGEGTVSEVEARLRRRDGEWRHVWAKLTNRLNDAAVSGVVVNISDVSERHEFEERLAHQALHDPLTGLPNRELLRRRMERAAANLRAHHSVLYLDCDDFKRVNDTLGHPAGDRYLIEVAARLSSCIRPEDTVARMGGDEFGILLEDTGTIGAVLVSERILRAVAEPMVIEGKELRPSASIGVVAGRLGAAHSDAVLGDADLAMYFAKRAGKGGFRVFVDAMRADLVDRLELGEQLRCAVEGERLAVAYQPIVELATGRVIGAEALARWHHPSRGWVGPDTFIPLAEELGLAGRIDAWVMREACLQGRRCCESFLPGFRMAVNLSGCDLDQPDLVEQVAGILEETGFAPGQLELELTEGVAINESRATQVTLQSLKALGVHLAIDDFGTGYSALSRLRNLPFDRLKVDKAFIDDIGASGQGPVLVDTILDMARVLGLEVVAEGVETPLQADYLRERKCDFAQGYLFSRPIPAAELRTLLEERHRSESAEAAGPPPPPRPAETRRS